MLVVDDRPLTSSMMVLALQSRGLEAHCCAVSSRTTILTTAASLPPGLVLLDLDLGQDEAGNPLLGVDLIADLQADGWRVLVVTGSDDEGRLAAAVMAGAEGVFRRSTDLPLFLELIEQAVAGRLIMPAAERRRWTQHHRRTQVESSRIDRLTARERDVLDHLASGQRAAVIARCCGLSLATVRSHIRAVLVKLEVNSQLEAVALLRNAREAP